MVDDGKQRFEDRSLVNKIIEGEQEAWETFYARFKPLVNSVAWRFAKPDRANAEDLCQEIWKQIFLALPKWKAPENLSGWTLKVSVNCSLSWLRRRKRVEKDSIEELSDAGWEPADGKSDPLGDLEQAELREALKQCLNGIGNENQRRALALFLQERSYEEIAQTLSDSEAALKITTVTNWIHRARRKLRECLSQQLPKKFPASSDRM